MENELKARIDKDYIEAYKAKNNALVAVLRILKSELKNTEIATKTEMKDEDVISVLKKQVKQRQETISIYQKSGKEDAAAAEQKEIDILNAYLPAQMSPEETRKIVEDTIQELQITDKSQIGKLIGAVVAKNKNSIDGAMVARIASELLSDKS